MSAKGLHLYVKQWLKLIVILSPRDFHLAAAAAATTTTKPLSPK